MNRNYPVGIQQEMADYLGAIITTIVFTGLFVMGLAKMDIEEIKGNWDTRRCELPVMLSAALYKPKENPISSMEFAQENFSFCTQTTFQTLIRNGLSPLFQIAIQQSNAMNGTSGVLNNVRTMLGNAVRSFGKMFDTQYRQYSLLNAAILKNWVHIMFSLGRLQGIATSIFYYGLSVGYWIQNLMDFTFIAILVFIGIMVILLFFLWFVLFPSVPLIVTIISIMIGAGIGAAAGMASAFCIDPDAKVYKKDGSLVSLKELKIGDELMHDSGDNRVTGFMEVEASSISLVELYGVKMSKSHRVKYKDEWILAGDHPDAIPTFTKLERLICLNTSTHSVPLKTTKDTILFASDWEEVDTPEGRKGWIDIVYKKLNTTIHNSTNYPTNIPLVSERVNVKLKDKGFIPISKVKLGDEIKTESGYTRVTGTYKGELTLGINQHISPEWISDGVWIRDESGAWNLNKLGLSINEKEEPKTIPGYFLITEDEQFTIFSKGKMYLVRDFTEIGAEHIDKTYEELDSFINKK